MSLLFYDIEVFKEDVIIVFKNEDKSTYKIMHNDFEGLDEIVTSFTLVGYNNYYYDDKIITLIMDGYGYLKIKDFNDLIIHDGYKVKVSPKIDSLDCFQQISVSKPSLKKVENNLGQSIIESSIDFNIDRKLTPDELEDTIKYCSYDVDTTIDVYKMRIIDYFTPKKAIQNMLGGNIRWNTTTITGNYFQSNNKLFLPIIDEDINKLLNHDLQLHFNNVSDNSYQRYILNEKGKTKSFDFNYYDNNIVIGAGGTHSTNNKFLHKPLNNIRCLDVASMYPNIMIKHNFLGSKTSKYKEILDKRLKLKSAGQTAEQLPYKLILNTVYGLLGNEYSAIYDINKQLSVCFIGQQYILYLAQLFDDRGIEIVQINTDGIFFIENGKSQEAKTIWEEDIGLVLDYDDYKFLIQKDVNNYIGEFDNGKLKLKGSFVNNYYANAYFNVNSCAIIDKMVVDKVVYGIPFHETVEKNKDNIILFQQVCSLTHKFVGTIDSEGVEHGNQNRVFATVDGLTELKKVKIVDGEKRYITFPDLPEHFKIYNDELDDKFDIKIDYNHYIKLAQRKYEAFMV